MLSIKNLGQAVRPIILGCVAIASMAFTTVDSGVSGSRGYSGRPKEAGSSAATTISVGNLDHNVTQDELRAAFQSYGEVTCVEILRDPDTGQPRGFGFVFMPNYDAAQKAIAGLNGTQMGQRKINVKEAEPRKEGPCAGS